MFEIKDKDLPAFSKIISEKIFFPKTTKTTSVFICGADIKNPSTGRANMASILMEKKKFELIYPEDLFDDLLAGQGKFSLLELENILATHVDVIILFPESPGSFAELGAFSNNPDLAKKMIVVSNKKYRTNKSFINYGPYRLVKSSKTGKVIQEDYSGLNKANNLQKLYLKVNKHILSIRKNHPVTKDVANILEAENFILPCIYLSENISILNLIKILQFATLLDEKKCEVAVRSAISKLLGKSFISRTHLGFSITKPGSDFVTSSFDSLLLDKARVETMNVLYRKNSKVDYDRI